MPLHLPRLPAIVACALLLSVLGLAAASPALSKRAPEPDAAAAAKVETLRDKPALLRALLLKMPKGAELHNHLSGAVYAEDYLAWADEKGLCVDVQAHALTQPPCAAPRVPARGLASRDSRLYNEMVDWLSVRGWMAGTVNLSGHDAFFSTFDRFGAIALQEHGKSIAAMRRSAAIGGVSYLELMDAPPTMQAGMAAPGDPKFSPTDLEGAYARLAPLLKDIASYGPRESGAADAEADSILGCGGANPEAACRVQTRYLCYGLRVFPPAIVFRHLAQCFALAEADPRYVGINIVAPEDDPVSLRDYDLHMRMIGFLAAKYPKVKISLHAGELTMGLAPASALRDHIAKAIEIGKATRIGHGVDIAFETDSAATLARMAKEGIAAEINFVSNAVILGVRGGDHPSALYRQAGVPIVLSTDDEGVLRTDITEQYVRAVTDQNFSYQDLKKAARDSLQYAFIEGDSLWAAAPGGARNVACTVLDAPQCARFIAESPKAALQQRLEKDLSAFEQGIVK